MSIFTAVMHSFMSLFSSDPITAKAREEKYLAQSVDHYDLELRQKEIAKWKYVNNIY
tara:strand:+ start:351 stop:521 length:171 start_codon:yes stop_codon:yes gene_type:complete